VLQQAGASVGVKVSPHVLRHTFGRQNADNGTDLESLRRLLGHRRIDTTAGYTKPRWENLEDAVDRIGVEI
jgi:integrase/recombinase XerC